MMFKVRVKKKKIKNHIKQLSHLIESNIEMTAIIIIDFNHTLHMTHLHRILINMKKKFQKLMTTSTLSL